MAALVLLLAAVVANAGEPSPKSVWKFDLTQVPGWHSPDYLVGKTWPGTQIAVGQKHVFVALPGAMASNEGLLLSRESGKVEGTMEWPKVEMGDPRVFFTPSDDLVLIRPNLSKDSSLAITVYDPGNLQEKRTWKAPPGERIYALPSCDRKQVLVQVVGSRSLGKPPRLLDAATLEPQTAPELDKAVLSFCDGVYIAEGFHSDGPVISRGQGWHALGAGEGYPVALAGNRIVLSDTRGICKCVDWIDTSGKHLGGFQWTIKHADVNPAIVSANSGRFAVNVLFDHAPKWINSPMLHRAVVVFDVRSPHPMTAIEIPSSAYNPGIAISPDGTTLVVQNKDSIESFSLPAASN